ncbi:MAG TPA: aldehyde ferredoxin oxidoreductase family protein [Anaerolineales bacterium]|nr:aldehyde ferredoxin oxidoreductase family protein [Anaerolineales bacterium]
MQSILSVNLTDLDIGQLEIPLDWERDFLGGASLAARLLYESLMLELDSLSPQAPLLFLNGPLSGTAGPTVGRFVVCARSPATGLWGESNCGGFWGMELRKAGFDGLLITGKAERPVYLWIEDRRIEIRPAELLWGLDTYQTQAAVKAEVDQKNARVATIGLAGENRLPFALILCDSGRVAGRTGMGAVMGSKHLKAIAVKGSGKIPLAEPERYAALRTVSNRGLRVDPMARVIHDLGTASAAEYFDYLQEMPKRYFQLGTYPEEIQTSGAQMKESILVGESGCHACVISCGRVVQLADGVRRKGPEYETMVGFGPNLMLNDLEVATRLGELCDRYGMDSISMSGVIGLAFALFEQGLISSEETGGLAMVWGDAGVVEQLVHQTARNQGFGAYLAEGARSLGRRFGAEEAAVQVNGLEVAYHDPRGFSGMALVYATSPRGACHNQSDYYLVDMGQAESSLGMQYYPPRGGVEKVRNVARHQDWRTLFNSLVMCFFSNTDPEMILALINAACGRDLDLADLMLVGERSWNLKRAINHRLGLRREHDRLPKALLQAYQDDPQGYIPDFFGMLAVYYEERGWDPTSGFPRREKLEQLGLGWAAEDLEKIVAVQWD